MASDTTIRRDDHTNSILKVYLRLRETKRSSDGVYYVDSEDPLSLVATAPENSETHKNSHRNHTIAVQKFKFSRIFVPKTTQAELFENTALPLLDECLNLENNGLLFTYGVTNSGKTHTVQGPRTDAGLLPRSLDLIFNTLGSHIKPKSMFCPHLHSSVCKMTEVLQQQREQIKHRVLYPPNTTQDLEMTGFTDPNSTTRCTVGSLMSDCTGSSSVENSNYQITDNVTVQLTNADNIQYSVWVSYLELYNENIYDLLHPPPDHGVIRPRNRPTLRLGEDNNMSVYVKGATQLEVTSFAEANRALVYGQRNRRKAATSLNQNSSRSHAIFKITVIATDTLSQQSKSSQISFVDLAGSERTNKTDAVGVRLKEAGNINTSLLTLGKCISSLKHNSKLRPRQTAQYQIVPFRESKLTRLFKNFLSGEGLLSMIVCVNPSPDFFDESIHALKFSALATEALLLPRPPTNSSQQSNDMENNQMSDEELQYLRYKIRLELMAEVDKRIKRIRADHAEEIEEVKERESTYYEGIQEGLQKYYASVIENLKDKVREARANNGNRGDTESEEKIEALQKECNDLREELKITKQEQSLFKAEIEQTLFQAKLELKTTQQLYNDVSDEKERFAKVVAEKDGEIKELFVSIEESTKLATFWEKECVDSKAARATEVEQLQGTIRQHGVKEQELENEIRDKNQVIESLSLNQLNNAGNKQLEEQIKLFKSELATEKVHHTQTTEDLNRNNAEYGLVKSELTVTKTELEKGKKEVKVLKENCKEYTDIITNLKTQLEKLQLVLLEQDRENKENIPDQVRSKLTSAQKEISDKNNVIGELQEELADIVRNKSLQFDTLICNKEKECEELEETLVKTKEHLSSLQDKILDLEAQLKVKSQKVLELQDLAGVQKRHLSSVEETAKTEAQKLQKQIDSLKDELLAERSAGSTRVNSNLENQKLKVEHELARQESDRLKVEIASIQRKMADEIKTYQDTIDAKDIKLQNWYDEKEKAVALITRKKEKEITELEKIIEEKETMIKDNQPSAKPVNDVTKSEEFVRLSEESTRKLNEMADMVIVIEAERDDLKTEYETFKTDLEEAISGKEAQFKSLREELDKSKEDKKRLEGAVEEALARSKELEGTVTMLKKEVEVIERKRQMSNDSSYSLCEPVRRSARLQSIQERDQTAARVTRSAVKSVTRKSKLSDRESGIAPPSRTSNISSRTSTTSTRSSTKSRPRTSTRRASQVLLTKSNKALNTVRSKRSRINPVEESPSSDCYVTPDTTAGTLKRKVSKKNIKSMFSMGTSPRRSKRSKAGPIEISESDSDFVTPAKPCKTQGKRKLHKSQISTPELMQVPNLPGLKDVEHSSEKQTRSRTKLIQLHMSGAPTRRTRNTRI